MKLNSCLVFVFFSVVFAFGQGDPMWLRYPAISPDGKTILFEYKGDIWSVDPAGGNAIPLTVSESYEFAPVWSHDGRSIAFASDRYGNFDVFVMPATGGEAKRLTYHSTREVPSSFTADDTAILFNAARQDSASNVQFPTGGMSEAEGRWVGHWSAPPVTWPDAQIHRAETRAQVAGAIAELPALQRQVLTLRDGEGLDADEICALLGVTAANQRVLLHRARARVRAVLERTLGAAP